MIGRVLASILLLSTGVHAATDVATRCCADRLRAAGTREKQLLACHARAAARGLPVDPACLAKVEEALTRNFGRIEANDGCPGTGNAAAMNADLAGLVGVIATTLRPAPTASACVARKLKATGRFASTTAKLFAGQAPQPNSHLDVLDPLTLPYGQRFVASIAALDTRPDCLTTGDGTRLVQFVTIGPFEGPFTPPGGMLLATARVCPYCGDKAQGGGEQCDGIDVTACGGGSCHADCTCAVCGDGVKNRPAEACDGADAAACQGLCQSDCTCPTPVCGNGVKEAGEVCDGAALGNCGNACQPDCTCAPAVCGNGVVEQGEQCEGTTWEVEPGITLGCSDCQGCWPAGAGGIGGIGCYDIPCCGTSTCLASPGGGYCQTAPPSAIFCTTDANCAPGYTCLPHPALPPTQKICWANPGSGCPTLYDPPTGASFTYPCVPPGVCTNNVCCLPATSTCTTNAECCSGTCTGGTCS